MDLNFTAEELAFRAHIRQWVAEHLPQDISHKVHHALHTPLMSVTNAISGIVVVAAILQINDTILAVQILAAFGVLLASINVFGGFAVTRRMLKMFTRGDQ